MKVFISSLITGMEAERAAAKIAVETLRHQPVMAEDFGARPTSPQLACLSGLRDSDAVVLVLAERYGYPQASGLAATHEEFREAKGRLPLLVFVQQGAAFEPAQKAFVDETGGWTDGLFRDHFTDAEDLRAKITLGLHRLELARAAHPVDPAGLARRALDLVPRANAQHAASSARLIVALAFGPQQTVLRPAELEQPSLSDDLKREALLGTHRIFRTERGTQRDLHGHALILHQPGAHHGTAASLRLAEDGSLLLELPLGDRTGLGDRMGLPMLIEEDIKETLATALGFAEAVAERIDPTQRLTHLSIAARIDGAGYMGWRTRSEHAASPNSASMGHRWNENREDPPIQLSPPHRPRAALTMERDSLVDDLATLLRRRWKS
jgi:hypothetical protein